MHFFGLLRPFEFIRLALKKEESLVNIISAIMKTFASAFLIAGTIAVQLNEPNPDEGPKRAYYGDSVTRTPSRFDFTRLVHDHSHADDWASRFAYEEFPEVFHNQVITYHRKPKARPDYVKAEEKVEDGPYGVPRGTHVVTLADSIVTNDPYPNWGPYLGNSGSTRLGPFDGRFRTYDSQAPPP